MKFANIALLVLAGLLVGCQTSSPEARSTKSVVQAFKKSNYLVADPAVWESPENALQAKVRMYMVNASAIIEVSNQRIFVDPPKGGVYHELMIDISNKGPEFKLDMTQLEVTTTGGRKFIPSIAFLAVDWRVLLRSHIHFNPATDGKEGPFLETLPKNSRSTLRVWFALPADDQEVVALKLFGVDCTLTVKTKK